jgi:hypothetical protein
MPLIWSDRSTGEHTEYTELTHICFMEIRVSLELQMHTETPHTAVTTLYKLK